jgi:hypothetical protein
MRAFSDSLENPRLSPVLFFVLFHPPLDPLEDPRLLSVLLVALVHPPLNPLEHT